MKIRNWLKKEFKYSNGFLLVILIMLVFLLCYSIINYKIGEHNSDLAQNMRYLNGKFDLNLHDTANDFNLYSPEEMYIHGENLKSKMYIISMLLCFLIGIITMLIYFKLLDSDKLK